MSKEFLAEVSFSAKIKMSIARSNKEKAKESIFDIITDDLGSNYKDITVHEIEWSSLEKESYVDDFCIKEEN